MKDFTEAVPLLLSELRKLLPANKIDIRIIDEPQFTYSQKEFDKHGNVVDKTHVGDLQRIEIIISRPNQKAIAFSATLQRKDLPELTEQRINSLIKNIQKYLK